MAKEKKTIQVEFIKNFANEQLSNPDYTLDQKLWIITMIEKVLLESNVYKGFRFLELPNGKAPELLTYEWVCRKYF